MALQLIDQEAPQPNGKRGEPARPAFKKVNDNFTEVMGSTAAGLVWASPASVEGDPSFRLLDMLHMPQGVRDAISTLKSGAKADVLGTVSQVGGVPTGAILEAGSNANGQFYRFASGLQICTRLIGNNNISAGGNYGTGTLTFPAAFSSSPLTLIHVNASFPYLLSQNCEPNVFPTSFAYSIRNGHSQNLSVYHGYVALGRWFG